MKYANRILAVFFFINGLIVIGSFSAVLAFTYSLRISDHIYNLIIIVSAVVTGTVIFLIMNPFLLKSSKGILNNDYGSTDAKQIGSIASYPLRAVPLNVLILVFVIFVYLTAGNRVGAITLEIKPAGFIITFIFIVIIAVIAQVYSFKLFTNFFVTQAIKKLNVVNLQGVYVPVRYKLIIIFGLLIISSYSLIMYAIYKTANDYTRRNLYGNTYNAISRMDGLINNNVNADTILSGMSHSLGNRYGIYLYDPATKKVKSYTNDKIPDVVLTQLDNRNIIIDKKDKSIFFLSQAPVNVDGIKYRLLLDVKQIYEQLYSGFINDMAFTGILMIIIILITAILVSDDISSNEKELTGYSIRLSDKDLTGVPDVLSTDEFASIGISMKKVILNFRESWHRMTAGIISMNNLITSLSEVLSEVKTDIYKQKKHTRALLGNCDSLKDFSQRILQNIVPLSVQAQDKSERINSIIQHEKELSSFINFTQSGLQRVLGMIGKSINFYEGISHKLLISRDEMLRLNEFSKSVDSRVEALISGINEIAHESNSVKAFNEGLTGLSSGIAAAAEEIDHILERLNIQFSSFSSHILQADDMLGIIHNVAERTNLLSINAFILAASPQTTEQNFKVVAEEIKKLAERARSGSREVSESTSAVRKTIENASSSIKLADQFSALIKQSFDDMSLSVNKISNSFEKLSGHLEEDKEIFNRLKALDAGNMTESIKTVDRSLEKLSSIIELLTKMKNSVTNLQDIFLNLTETKEKNGATSNLLYDSVDNMKAFTGYINDTLAAQINGQIDAATALARELFNHLELNEKKVNELEETIKTLSAGLDSFSAIIRTFRV